MTPELGIEKLWGYPSSLSLDLHSLCVARGMDADRTVADLMIHERSLNPPWEDAVTMAVNAAAPMLTDEDRDSIGLLLVGTESSVDQEKAVSTWIHDCLGLRSDCLNLEIKLACFASTGALHLALAWLESGLSRGRKALLISSDQTTMHIGKPWEPVGGSGAVAVLLSREPQVIAYEPGKFGIHSEEVSDVIRPTMRVETGNSETSLFSYLIGVEGAYRNYAEVVGNVPFPDYFKRIIYHVPFGEITYRAHKTLLREFSDVSTKAARRSFAEKTEPSLVYNRRMGATYGASTFIALLGLLEHDSEVAPGDRLGLFAYGSGSCAEFYSALVKPEARAVARAADLGRQIEARRPVTVEEYERIERVRNDSIAVPEFEPDFSLLGDLYERFYRGQKKLVLRQVHEYYRTYAWS